jgi:hypothetical protein
MKRLSPGGLRHMKEAIAGAHKTTQPNGFLRPVMATPAVCPRYKGDKEIVYPPCKGAGEYFRFPCAICITRGVFICPRSKGKGVVKHYTRRPKGLGRGQWVGRGVRQ